MWKKNGRTVFLTVGLLTLVLLFCVFSEVLLKYPLRQLEDFFRLVFASVRGEM